jgi:hypothetical protein
LPTAPRASRILPGEHGLERQAGKLDTRGDAEFGEDFSKVILDGPAAQEELDGGYQACFDVKGFVEPGGGSRGVTIEQGARSSARSTCRGAADRGCGRPVCGRWRHEAAGQRDAVSRAVAR